MSNTCECELLFTHALDLLQYEIVV